MSAHLFCRYGEMVGTTYELGEDMFVGRSKTNQIILPHNMVSGSHARLYLDHDRGCYMVEDLGSTNGTLVDGKPIDEPVRLHHLHMINFGGIADFFFFDDQSYARRRATLTPSNPAPEPTPVSSGRMEPARTATEKDFAPPPPILGNTGKGSALAEEDLTADIGSPTPIPKALINRLPQTANTGQARTETDFILIVAHPSGDHKYFSLSEGENVVGRTLEADIQIENREISRKHAVLTVKDGTVTIRDEKSANHVYVEGQKISEEVEVTYGTRINFGKIKAKLDKGTS